MFWARCLGVSLNVVQTTASLRLDNLTCLVRRKSNVRCWQRPCPDDRVNGLGINDKRVMEMVRDISRHINTGRRDKQVNVQGWLLFGVFPLGLHHATYLVSD
ncbi:hypothetical protein [uncultured Photobacterium sp.]|uniref:hypothetical protein n=1 Tax=uncultured Photobacterium sp. TaxID=173973 RepID=UPI00263306EB|nr:hypothetical protein [uncultured Photobacterium sp.]